MFREENTQNIDLGVAFQIILTYTINDFETTTLKKTVTFLTNDKIRNVSFYLGNEHDIKVTIINVTKEEVLLKFDSYNSRLDETFSIPTTNKYCNLDNQMIIKKGESVILDKPNLSNESMQIFCKKYSIIINDIKIGRMLDR